MKKASKTSIRNTGMYLGGLSIDVHLVVMSIHNAYEQAHEHDNGNTPRADSSAARQVTHTMTNKSTTTTRAKHRLDHHLPSCHAAQKSPSG